VGRVARRVAAAIVRELPDFGVSGRAGRVDGVWSMPLELPPVVDVETFAAAMAAENVPCAATAADGIRLLLDPSYSDEEVEHLVLAVAKVGHYLLADRATAHD
jgi:hypothetical protein